MSAGVAWCAPPDLCPRAGARLPHVLSVRWWPCALTAVRASAAGRVAGRGSPSLPRWSTPYFGCLPRKSSPPRRIRPIRRGRATRGAPPPPLCSHPCMPNAVANRDGRSYRWDGSHPPRPYGLYVCAWNGWPWGATSAGVPPTDGGLTTAHGGERKSVWQGVLTLPPRLLPAPLRCAVARA